VEPGVPEQVEGGGCEGRTAPDTVTVDAANQLSRGEAA